MELSGQYRIAASPEQVWEGLNDPVILKNCIPECERLERVGDNAFAATVTLKIGLMKASFKGMMTLRETDPPHRCVLTGEGQGGAMGFARGEAEVVLTPDGEGTILAYTAHAEVGGKLTEIGQRQIDGTANRLAHDFFARFQNVLDLEKAPQLEPDPMMEPQAAALGLADDDTEARDGAAPEIWVVGLIGVVIILLVVFGIAL